MKYGQNSAAFWGETWALTLQALRVHKVRAALAMLGVVIGSACIVLVVTVALTGRKYVLSQIEGIGANLIYAYAIAPDGPESLPRGDLITPGDLQAIREGVSSDLVNAAGASAVSVTAFANGQQRAVNLVGVTEGFRQIRHLQILAGSYFVQDDFASTNKICLLTKPLGERLFPRQNAVGQIVRVGEMDLNVIGIFQEREATLGASEIVPQSVLVPFSLLHYYTGFDYFQNLYVQASGADAVPEVTSQVGAILRVRHRAGAEYSVQNLMGVLQTARDIARALTWILVAIALIALTISGIGIMNIMLVTVTERTREIGILKAIGATREAILYQFLLEAFTISGAGAVGGIAIAVFLRALVNFVIGVFPDVGNITLPISWVSVVLAFVVSCATGLIFGYLPANRAARLQPIESLRHE
ncbi:MAG: ABC transporter permease [Acidobacteriota bacterium]|nr:ABC transporter permease [Acidobacteriota bacterium]